MRRRAAVGGPVCAVGTPSCRRRRRREAPAGGARRPDGTRLAGGCTVAGKTGGPLARRHRRGGLYRHQAPPLRCMATCKAGPEARPTACEMGTSCPSDGRQRTHGGHHGWAILRATARATPMANHRAQCGHPRPPREPPRCSPLGGNQPGYIAGELVGRGRADGRATGWAPRLGARMSSSGQEVRDLLARLGRALIDASAVGLAQHPAS